MICTGRSPLVSFQQTASPKHPTSPHPLTTARRTMAINMTGTKQNISGVILQSRLPIIGPLGTDTVLRESEARDRPRPSIRISRIWLGGRGARRCYMWRARCWPCLAKADAASICSGSRSEGCCPRRECDERKAAFPVPCCPDGASLVRLEPHLRTPAPSPVGWERWTLAAGCWMGVRAPPTDTIPQWSYLRAGIPA
jgi:hypothetical protein